MAADRRGARLAVALLALAAAGTAFGIAGRGSARPIALNQSIASLAASAAALVVAGFFGGLALRPRSLDAAIDFCRAIRSAEPRSIGGWATGIGLLGAAIAFLAINAHYRRLNLEPRDDQADYLAIAQSVARLGGPFALPGLLMRGEFVEDNRHPAYLALLSIRPTMEVGICLSTTFAIMTIGLATWAAWRVDGRRAALAVAWLLAFNRSLHESATLVACETLLGFFVLASWLTLAQSRHALLAGGLLGLAYLTKASAFLLEAVAALWLFAARRGAQKFHWRQAALAIAGFGAVASPLLVRNCRVYGNPLHGYNNRLMLADNFESGRAEPDLGWRGNWDRFRARHDWNEILRDRLGAGLAMEAFVILRALGPWPLDSARAPLGLVVLGLALLSTMGTARGGLLAGWLAVSWLFFAWYLPIAASDRFILPLVPIVILESARVLCRLPQRTGTAGAEWSAS